MNSADEQGKEELVRSLIVRGFSCANVTISKEINTPAANLIRLMKSTAEDLMANSSKYAEYQQIKREQIAYTYSDNVRKNLLWIKNHTFTLTAPVWIPVAIIAGAVAIKATTGLAAGLGGTALTALAGTGAAVAGATAAVIGVAVTTSVLANITLVSAYTSGVMAYQIYRRSADVTNALYRGAEWAASRANLAIKEHHMEATKKLLDHAAERVLIDPLHKQEFNALMAVEKTLIAEIAKFGLGAKLKLESEEAKRAFTNKEPPSVGEAMAEIYRARTALLEFHTNEGDREHIATLSTALEKQAKECFMARAKMAEIAIANQAIDKENNQIRKEHNLTSENFAIAFACANVPLIALRETYKAFGSVYTRNDSISAQPEDEPVEAIFGLPQTSHSGDAFKDTTMHFASDARKTTTAKTSSAYKAAKEAVGSVRSYFSEVKQEPLAKLQLC